MVGTDYSSDVYVYVRPAEGASIQSTMPTVALPRTPVTWRVEGTAGTSHGLKLKGENDDIVPFRSFGGIGLLQTELLRKLPGLEAALRPLVD